VGNHVHAHAGFRTIYLGGDVPLDYLQITLETVEIPPVARTEIVEHSDTVPLFQEIAHKVAADESGTASDEYFQEVTPGKWRVGSGLSGPEEFASGRPQSQHRAKNSMIPGW
jgi:hypothetical protein